MEPSRTFQSTRRQQVQHCRFLRGQIRDFEAKFEKKHGRLPKASERGTQMSAIYEQYKRQKRSIRDGAATQVQAVLRGSYVRMHLNRGESGMLRKSSIKTNASGSDPHSGSKFSRVGNSATSQSQRKKINGHSQKRDPGIDKDAPLATLHEEKKKIKQQLKKFDTDYKRQHNRFPNKQEKEPIRHLYERYNEVKGAIAAREKGK